MVAVVFSLSCPFLLVIIKTTLYLNYLTGEVHLWDFSKAKAWQSIDSTVWQAKATEKSWDLWRVLQKVKCRFICHWYCCKRVRLVSFSFYFALCQHSKALKSSVLPWMTWKLSYLELCLFQFSIQMNAMHANFLFDNVKIVFFFTASACRCWSLHDFLYFL